MPRRTGLNSDFRNATLPPNRPPRFALARERMLDPTVHGTRNRSALARIGAMT
jgi:hypothetical protein